MAFSTQKEFFNVPFMNEHVDLGCKKACVKLKRYESTIDNRAWASDETKQSKFLSDLVTCQNPIDADDVDDFSSSIDDQDSDSQLYALRPAKDGHRKGEDKAEAPSTSGYSSKAPKGASSGGQSYKAIEGKATQEKALQRKAPQGKAPQGKALQDPSSAGYNKKNKDDPPGPSPGGHKNKIKNEPIDISDDDDSPAASKKREGSPLQAVNLTGGDSLLECANIHLAEYQKVLNIKTTLEKQLDVSNERLKTAKEENAKIREILATKLDSNTAKSFYNKIQKFSASGKLDKNEENEMLQIYQKMENMNKAYEILQSENNYLKRLIEKLNARVSLDNITIKPEESNDVGYLQKEINRLRKECILLRQMEDEFHKLKQQQTNKLPSISEQDAENIKAIIKERNSLREKCKSFKGLEQQIKLLEQKTQEAKDQAGGLSNTLSNKTQYINKMEGEMQDMQKYYEDKCQKSCFAEECLKMQLEDLKEELIRARCEAQKADMLAMEVSCLRNEILKRDLALNDYDCQYKQLMDIVNELQSVRLQYLHDNQTQTACKEQTDELAFYTSATLNEIMKELKKKGCLDDNLLALLGLDTISGGKNKIDEMKKLMQQGASHADAIKRLQELEANNSQLLQENVSFNERFRESDLRMTNALRRMEMLGSEIDINGEETSRIGKDLAGTLKLVKGISDVQMENQQLTNAVSAINSRDDQKIIDDLRRQLEQELAKLRQCQQDNCRLQEENNRLEADNDQLQNTLCENGIEIDLTRESDTDFVASVNKKGHGGKEHDGVTADDITAGYSPDYPAGTSAGKGGMSPGQSGMPPGKGGVSPGKGGVSPGIGGVSPGKGGVSSGRGGVSPGQNGMSPGKSGMPLAQSGISQGKGATYPDQDSSYYLDEYGTSADQGGMPPGQRGMSPSQRGMSPGQRGMSPGQRGMSPSQRGMSPGQRGMSPGQRGMTPVQSGLPLGIGATYPDKGASYSGEYPPALGTSTGKGKISPGKGGAYISKTALDDFVNKKSDALRDNLQQGSAFEKEFRKILEDFILECRQCVCRLFNPKSRLYSICHKLSHSGIDTLSFRELAYLHKKIYSQADQLLPGCLLDMILSDHKEQVELMLKQAKTHSMDNKNMISKISDKNESYIDQKCCCCKNELCCTNSEQMLKDKGNYEKLMQNTYNTVL